MAGYYKHEAVHDPSMHDMMNGEMPEPTNQECIDAFKMDAGADKPRDNRTAYEEEMKKMMGPMPMPKWRK